jgi:ABC-type nitrate/sulfonate/bicarbonate transport system permease component
LFIGIALGVVAGIMLAINHKIWLIFEPIVEFFRSLPSIVLVPLIGLFLGVGLESKLTCVIMVVAVTIISTLGIAMRSINTTYIKLQYAWKLSLKNSLQYLYLPEISSHLIVAIKASIPLALIVAVASDMLIATDNGIGKIITDSMAVVNTTRMYAAIIVVGILGYLSAKFSTYIEKSFIHWKGK